MVDIFIDHQPHQVFTRSNWSGDWTVRHYLYANSVRWAAKPTMDEAELEYRYGDIMRPNTAFFAKGNPLSIDGHYVKIVIEQGEDRDDLVWYGVLVERSDELRGSDGTSPNGRTHYTAYGLEYLLSKLPVVDSHYKTSDDGESYVNRAIGFNTAIRDAYDGDSRASMGSTRQGNMSETPGFNDAPVFRKITEDGTTWSAANIIEYLLAYNAPLDSNGNEAIRFVLDYTSAIEHLTWATPVVEVRKHTVLDLLNELCDRRRLTSWRLVVESDDTVSVVVFTFNASAIGLPDGSTIPANENTVTWNFDSQVEIASAVLMQDRSAKFDYVLVRGERKTSTFTLTTSGALVKDWETADETAYIAGAGVGATVDAIQQANRAYRASDRFKRVYSYFKLSNSWTGTSWTGEKVFPELDSAGEVTNTSEKIWLPGLRFNRRLPLQHDVDYSGLKIANDELVDTSPAGSLPEYLAPIILIEAESGKYRHIEKLSTESGTDTTTTSPEFGWSAGVRMQDEAPGFVLDVRGDAPQHALAGADFTGADATDNAEFSSAQALDWEDITATICMEADSYCQGVWPTGAPLEETDTLRALLIEVPNARLDYVVPDTVVKLDASGARVTSEGGFITDDRKRVENLARMAYEWYAATRYALHVSQNDLVIDYSVGQLITTIEHGTLARTINSVITDIALDLLQGTASVKTQFGQLDFGGL